jgi:tripartite-type tricarboxylate transporter receptor subunit TctC
MARINSDLVKVLNMPDVQEKLAAQGAQVVAQGPAEFATFLNEEVRKWGAVARKAQIKIE